ncbi:uncharacterized protein LOC129577163 [Sitodiplosis mosellana]|uniref:uncharacterized protein LOC129577163 n=1 Tax=Sitodiplosis mosellana TaxID=263140 RepID=UPI0024446032|nr:uncharacterized protein LOC129577163 [Sitodiplosis mosellana]
MAQYEIVKDTNKTKFKLFGFVIFLFILIVGYIVLFRSASATGPPDGKTVICVKFISSPELVNEFKTSGINQTSERITEPDLNLCSHLICSDTYMRLTNDVDFIWTNEKRKQYVDCVNSRRSYPHLKVLYSVRYTPYGYLQIGNDTKKRKQFTRRVFNMVTRNHFDGLNLNWQDSMQESLANIDALGDKSGIDLLLKELNEKFDLLIGTFASDRFLTFIPHKEHTAHKYKDVQYIELPIKL